MSVETNVDLTVWCDDYHALEDMLRCMTNADCGMKMSPWLYDIRDSVEEQYFESKSVERGSKDGTYFMKLHGMAHHLSVRDWFVLPVGEMREAFKSGGDPYAACGDKGFFVKFISMYDTREFDIECRSEGPEHLDDHEITMNVRSSLRVGDHPENKILLKIDGIDTESGYSLDIEE